MCALLSRLLERSKLVDGRVKLLGALFNLCALISAPAVMAAQLETIRRYHTDDEAAVHLIEDFCAGRSLDKVDVRLDAMESRISALNTQVLQVCTNVDDVKRYMDAHIAEIKEFVAEVAKKNCHSPADWRLLARSERPFVCSSRVFALVASLPLTASIGQSGLRWASRC